MTNTDFAFLAGHWTSHQRRLTKVLAGQDEWYEFTATLDSQLLLDGACVFDVVRAPERDIEGITLRLYDPAEQVWRIWWAAKTSGGRLDAPVVGRFEGPVGRFECEDTWEGRPILVRYEWNRSDPGHPTWQQSFSPDAGETWELNWTATFSRP
jgi:hypothetical protein